MACNRQTAGGRTCRVLIVEDECLIADYLSMLIEDAGHNVAGIAGSAEAALDILAREPAIDLVTLDMNLAGAMDGVALAAHIRARHGTPFVFFTGSVDAAARRNCEAQAPLMIMQKPIDPAVLARFLAGFAPDRHHSGAAGHGDNRSFSGVGQSVRRPDGEAAR